MVEGFEGLLLEGCPSPRLIFTGKEVQRGDHMGEVGNKLPIEICKSKEGADAFD